MDDHDLAIRRAIIRRLKNSAAVTSKVADRIFEEVDPNAEWPFVRYGFPIVERIKVDGWKMLSHSLTIHAFAKGPGTDNVSELAAAIVDALDEAELDLEGNAGVCIMQHAGHNLLRDSDEASAYHAAISFEAVTAEIAAP